MTNASIKFGLSALAIAAGVLIADSTARAGLTLTAAGIADGFNLTMYAGGGQATGTYTYIAAAPLSDGTLAVVDYAHGFVRKYADVDGQTPNSALASHAISGIIDAARLGGVTYVSTLGGGLYSIDNALNPTAVPVAGLPGGFSYGLASDEINGRLYAGAGGGGIYAINPLTGIASLVAGSAGIGFDGVSVSPDGQTVYGEAGGGGVLGYNVNTGAKVFTYTSPGHGPDGTGVISGGKYNGYVIVNNNDGSVSLVTPDGLTEVVIASGGTRGDLTSPDTITGTLLLSEIGESWRLKAPGGTFGTATPEPSTIVSCGIAAAAAALYALRRRRGK